jgi:hypothetical protein
MSTTTLATVCRYFLQLAELAAPQCLPLTLVGVQTFDGNEFCTRDAG